MNKNPLLILLFLLVIIFPVYCSNCGGISAPDGTLYDISQINGITFTGLNIRSQVFPGSVYNYSTVLCNDTIFLIQCQCEDTSSQPNTCQFYSQNTGAVCLSHPPADYAGLNNGVGILVNHTRQRTGQYYRNTLIRLNCNSNADKPVINRVVDTQVSFDLFYDISIDTKYACGKKAPKFCQTDIKSASITFQSTTWTSDGEMVVSFRGLNFDVRAHLNGQKKISPVPMIQARVLIFISIQS